MIEARSGFAPRISARWQGFGTATPVPVLPTGEQLAPVVPDAADADEAESRLFSDVRLFVITFAAGFLFFTAWLA